MRTFFRQAGEDLRDSGWEDACPIGTVALETASTSERMREACAEVFGGWIVGLAAYFAAAGVEDPTRARELATAMIAALEGAFVLARAMRTTDPLDVAGETVAAAVAEALSARTAGGAPSRGRRARP